MDLSQKTDDELYDLFDAVIDELNKRKSRQEAEELKEILTICQ